MFYLYLDWYRCAILISTGVLVLLPACEGNYKVYYRRDDSSNASFAIRMELKVPGFTPNDTCEEARVEFGRIQMRSEQPCRNTLGRFTKPLFVRIIRDHL